MIPARKPAHSEHSPADDGIAEKLRASEAHVRGLEAHFRTTMEQLPIGIAQVDFDDRIMRVNSAFCTLMGSPAEDLVGRLFAEFNHPADLKVSSNSLQRLLRGEVETYSLEERYVRKDGGVVWARVTVAPSRNAEGELDGAVGILEDITERKAAEAEVEKVHKELLHASHQAGMAEVASNVLHNVGNVLNSLNVSANMVVEQVKDLKALTLTRMVDLIRAQSADYATFFSQDERGKRIPDFLAQLALHLANTQNASLKELTSLMANIEHIKDIIATQQTFAKQCGVTDTVEVSALVEDSLAMNRGAFARHGVALTRSFLPVPSITVQKHKVLQILVNLERNAKHACEASTVPDKEVTVSIEPCDLGVKIQISDNGVGISAENMKRLFTHGFTTRAEGHGFGLHSGALTAKELGGRLEAFSAGPGQGATFTLTLPLQPPV